MSAAHHEIAVLAGVDGVDVDGQVPVPVAGADAPVEPVPAPVVVQDPDDRLGGRRFHELTLARDLVAIEERGEDPDGRRGPADLVRHPHGRAGGPSAELLREARAVNESAGRLSGRVQVARLVLGRPPLALLPYPAVDEPRVDLLELPVADSPRVELPRRVVLDQDVDVDGELLEELAALRLLEIERDGLLVPHLVEEVEADRLAGLGVLDHVLLAPERRLPPQRVAVGRLALDGVGAQLREHRGGPVADDHPLAQVEDADRRQVLGFLEVLALPELLLEREGIFLGLVRETRVDLVGCRDRDRRPRQDLVFGKRRVSHSLSPVRCRKAFGVTTCARSATRAPPSAATASSPGTRR